MVDQTFATAIRDGALSRLQAAPPSGVVAANITTTPLPPMQGAAVPAMRVLLLSEDMTPDGDYNVAEPKFIHDASIGLSAVSVADSEGETETNIDAIVNDALATLICDGTFMELFEGITAIRRTYSFPNQGESYFAEVRLQMTVRFRTVWPPNAPYALDEIDVYPVPAFGPAPTIPILVNILPQSSCLTGVAGIGLAGSLV